MGRGGASLGEKEGKQGENMEYYAFLLSRGEPARKPRPEGGGARKTSTGLFAVGFEEERCLGIKKDQKRGRKVRPCKPYPGGRGNPKESRKTSLAREGSAQNGAIFGGPEGTEEGD